MNRPAAPGQLTFLLPDPEPGGPPPRSRFVWPGTRCRVLSTVPELAGQLVRITGRVHDTGIVWGRTADGFDCPFHPEELEVLDETDEGSPPGKHRHGGIQESSGT